MMKEDNKETIVTFRETIPLKIPDFLLIWDKKIGMANIQILD